MTKLYVDDVRKCPKGWDLAKDYFKAIEMLKHTDYDEVSLDHDLASYDPVTKEERTGVDIVHFLIRRKIDYGHVPPIINVHSANPVGSKRMRDDIDFYLSDDDTLDQLRKFESDE